MFRLPNGITIRNVPVTKGILGPGSHVLIGMDVITLGDFSVTNVGGQTVFTFRVPSVKAIDYVAEVAELKESLQSVVRAIAPTSKPMTANQRRNQRKKDKKRRF